MTGKVPTLKTIANECARVFHGTYTGADKHTGTHAVVKFAAVGGRHAFTLHLYSTVKKRKQHVLCIPAPYILVPGVPFTHGEVKATIDVERSLDDVITSVRAKIICNDKLRPLLEDYDRRVDEAQVKRAGMLRVAEQLMHVSPLLNVTGTIGAENCVQLCRAGHDAAFLKVTEDEKVHFSAITDMPAEKAKAILRIVFE